MSVSQEDEQLCKYSLLKYQDDITPLQVNRFIENANKTTHKKCPHCGGGSIYFCPAKKVISSNEERSLMAFFTFGISNRIGNDNNVCWCSNCTNSGSQWF